MPFMPFNILGMWFRGLLAIALLGLSIYLLREWYERATTVHEPIVVADAERRRARRSRELEPHAPARP